ncbi:CD8A protein, partial [Serilophus lunatus]|nr:CD8A protein [Serilophus lunatus]
MEESPALLLLLALGFCEYGHRVVQGDELTIRFRVRFAQLQVGQRLELECQTGRDSGAFWVHQDKSGILHFIVFISSISQPTFHGNQRTSTRFETSKDNSSYRLVVKSLTPQDEGNYFCLMNNNTMLYFSPGLLVFLPVTTTVAPTTTGLTTARPSTQHGNTKKDLCLNSSDSGIRMQEELNSFCHSFIWVPFAGLCLLLLQLLAVTITL